MCASGVCFGDFYCFQLKPSPPAVSAPDHNLDSLPSLCVCVCVCVCVFIISVVQAEQHPLETLAQPSRGC